MSDTLLRATKAEKLKFRKNYSPIKFRRWEGSLSIPKGLNTLEHQIPCAKYALNRNRAYLGLAPGLGKTPIAALIAQGMKLRTLYICPKMLVYNTYEEFKKWNPSMSVSILNEADWIVPEILIVPDSILDKFETRLYIRYFNPQVIIIDEAHRFKEMTAKRTQSLLGYKDKDEGYIPGIVDRRDLKKLVFMSGTPMPNRPIELYPVVAKSCPEYIDFKNKIEFGLTYCKAYFDGKSYDFRGCNEEALKNLKEVMVSKNANDRYGFMLRMDKNTITLPQLTEEIVVLGDGKISRELKGMQQEIFKKFSTDDLIKKALIKKLGKEEIHIATYRRLLGMEKVSHAVEFLKDILDNTDENLLVFAIHKEVIKALSEKLSDYSPLVATGDTNTKLRHQMVREYQTNKKKKLFIGNIDAMGVGHTLTKADRIPLVEFSYVPGVNRQAIDRGHRFGLDHPILAQYIALANSLDKPVLESLRRKEKITAII